MPMLSIAVPVFNEEKRLPEKLTSYADYLEKNFPDYEIVFVNDGSYDNTLKVLETLSSANPKIRFINNDKNRGRGFAMRVGVLAAQGDYILETDADFPVSPDHIKIFMDFLDGHPEYDLIIGSREHPDSKFAVKQPPLRVFAGKIFHIIFGLAFGMRFNDVMCGFKMFRRDAAKDIFKFIYDSRYLAAGEIIFVARKFGYRIKELPVVWQDDKRSKVRVFKDSLRTLWGILKMFSRDWQGKYDKHE